MLATLNDYKVRLISLITSIEDVGKLKTTYEELASGKEIPSKRSGKLSFDDAGVVIGKAKSFDFVFEEQGGKRPSYDRIQQIAGSTEWDHSLDELLTALR